MNKFTDKYMSIALEEAKNSLIDVPVGAVLVKDDKIIAKACNKKEQLNDPTLHAEIIAIREAAAILNSWRLDGMSLYVTLEPCPMCASAILYSRIPYIYFGAYDSLYGAFGSALDMTDFIRFKPSIIGGIREEESQNLLKNFFKKKREIKK